MGFIYKITSPNHKLYIGKTYSIKNRISDYRCLRYRSKKSIIIDSIKKHGWDAHIFEVIEEVQDELMDEREIFWIAELKTYAYENKEGMNLTKGGDGQRHSWKNDAERVAKAKLRCGENSPTYGKKLSEEEKIKIAQSVYTYNIKNGVKPSELAHKNSAAALSIPIIVYNLNGIFVGEYKSIKSASIELNVGKKTLNDALNGRQYHGGGYIPKRKIDNYPLQIEVDKSKVFLKRRPIVWLYKDTILGEFFTLKEVSNAAGINYGTVEDAFYGKRKTRKGHYFIYKDLYEGILKAAS